MSTVNYDEYIRSDAWRVKRAEAISRAGHKCQLCGKPRKLTVHHNTYARLGNERSEDLIALCWPCHSGHHRRNDNRITSEDMVRELTPSARRMFRRANLEEQTVMLTPSERRRRNNVANRFFQELSKKRRAA